MYNLLINAGTETNCVYVHLFVSESLANIMFSTIGIDFLTNLLVRLPEVCMEISKTLDHSYVAQALLKLSVH